MSSRMPDRYSGKRIVLYAALVSHDPWDQFAWCQEWRFAIADVLHFQRGENVPYFYPSPMGPDEDSYAYSELSTAAYTVEELRYAYDILTRFREWLGIAGQDY